MLQKQRRFMIYIRVISILLLVCFSFTPVWAERNISFPHSEDFTDSDSIDDISWVVNGATIGRVAQSWRGGGNYCVKITPPTSTDGGNGGYSAIGNFQGFSAATLNVSFALFIGTTYNDTAAADGGGLVNKFLDVHGAGSRTGLFSLQNDGTDYEFALMHSPTTVYWYYEADGTPGTNSGDATAVQFDSGSRDVDYAGEWIFVNYIISATSETLYVYDRDGDITGEYMTISSTAGENHTYFLIGGYYNSYHPTADANTYMLIDDLYITNAVTPHTVPTGFVGGEPEPPANAIQGVSISNLNVTENLTAWNRTDNLR